MTMAEADHAPEKAVPTEPPNATRYSPVNISPSAIVNVTGPRPDPVLTKDAFTGPSRCAAAFIGKRSAVSVVAAQPANRVSRATARAAGSRNRIMCRPYNERLERSLTWIKPDRSSIASEPLGQIGSGELVNEVA